MNECGAPEIPSRSENWSPKLPKMVKPAASRAALRSGLKTLANLIEMESRSAEGEEERLCVLACSPARAALRLEACRSLQT